ncbi:MAG: UDP-N-acetylglucosamine diphosphorylase/glucosamine-1-phosphate N-acetyltransferase [Candidatus Epulonipiscioides saccharophilum]|nr:MAG: UDP-N-acetylglucosamine diphosphorylase/glucosamine-1-phosphate N-acetyltransferase [Epulopiscium sp. AS2M-Bin001]
MKIKAVILAAGKGTRMKSSRAKVLHKIFDRALIEYPIQVVKELGADVCLVVGYMEDDVKKTIGDQVQYRVQEEQLGTGHAVMQAIDFMDDSDLVLILYGDTPLITTQTLQELINYHLKHHSDGTALSTKIENPFGYGRIVRNGFNEVEKIVEERDADKNQKRITEINGGMYVFNTSKLLSALHQLDNNNSQNEYYFTDVLKIILAEDGKIDAFMIKDSTQILGVNSKVQLAEAASIMKMRINNQHMLNGVIIEDPLNTYIEPDVEIGIDTVIEPSCVIKSNTKIGAECRIGFNTKITNSILEDNVDVESSVIVDSKIGQNTHIGPFAYIRPNNNIGSNVKIGDFVELKNSNIGSGTKISHLTYVGDADVGQNVNFGCGTVLVNYDGKNKYRSEIQDNVFIGCNSNLVSPVVLHEHSYIAAGSTITKDVPENTLAIARSKQENKEGRAKNRNSKS